MIEAWGSGIPKLMEAMREYGLREPEFRDMEIGFRINLYRYTEDVLEDATQDTTQVTQGTTQVRLSEEDKAILVVIKEQHNITQKEIAAKLDWKVDRVKYYLNKMKRRNIVKRVRNQSKGILGDFNRG